MTCSIQTETCTIPKTFGLRLRALRQAHGLSQQAVADTLGQARSSISHYEDSLFLPSANTLCKLADLYGVTLEELTHMLPPKCKRIARRRPPVEKPKALQPAIGLRLIALRKERGLKQIDVANRVGISRGTLSAYEQGRGTPSVGLLHSLSVLYGITMDDLILKNPEGGDET